MNKNSFDLRTSGFSSTTEATAAAKKDNFLSIKYFLLSFFYIEGLSRMKEGSLCYLL